MTTNVWYFSQEDLDNLPSIKEGIPKQQELDYRRATSTFIHEVGVAMKIPQLAIATASVYFHRFYVLHSFKAYDRFLVATTCLFLAGKAEETPRKLQDVILAADGVLRNVAAQQQERAKAALVPDSPEYDEFREKVLQMERILLQTLAFDLKIEHPYKDVQRNLKAIGAHKEVAQVAWNFANDSFRTALCLQFQPKSIAAAAVYLAVNFKGIALPEGWAEKFETSAEETEAIANQILDLYEGSDHARRMKASVAASQQQKKQ